MTDLLGEMITPEDKLLTEAVGILLSRYFCVSLHAQYERYKLCNISNTSMVHDVIKLMGKNKTFWFFVKAKPRRDADAVHEKP